MGGSNITIINSSGPTPATKEQYISEINRYLKNMNDIKHIISAYTWAKTSYNAEVSRGCHK